MMGARPAAVVAGGVDRRQEALETFRDRFLTHCWAYSRDALGRGLFWGRDDSPEICSNTCRPTSVFLRMAMGQAGDAWQTVEGTMLDTQGVARAHVWLCNGSEILDLTAAQFGWRGGFIAPAGDTRYAADSKQPTQKATARKCATMVERWTTGRGATLTSDGHPLLAAVRERLGEIEAFGRAWTVAITMQDAVVGAEPRPVRAEMRPRRRVRA